MKKKYSFIAVLLIAVILVFGCLFFQNRSHEEKEEKKTLRPDLDRMYRKS